MNYKQAVRFCGMMLLATGILLIDEYVAWGICVPVLYVLVVLLSARFHARFAPLIVAFGCTLLTLLGISYGGGSELTKVMIANRTLAVVAIWTTAIAVHYWQHAEKIRSSLRASEAPFEQMMRGITDYAIYMLNIDGTIATWNSGAQRIKGYAEEEVIGRSFAMFFTPEDAKAGKPKHILDTAATTGRYEEHGTRVRKDGTRFTADVVAVPLYDAEGNLHGFAKVTRDITQKQEQAKIKQRTERLASIGTMAAGIAHEVYNPLTAAWTSALAASRLAGDPAKRTSLDKALKNIIASIRRCQSIVNDVQAFAQQDNAKAEPVDLNELIKSALALTRPHAKSHGTQVLVELPDTALHAYINRPQIERVLINLLHNACEAGSSSVTISAEYDKTRKNKTVRITITDDGCGMTEQQLNLAFDPFYTSNKPTGTGLGLSIVHGFVEKNRGSIKLESHVGKGTTAIMHLPAENSSTSDDILPESSDHDNQ